MSVRWTLDLEGAPELEGAPKTADILRRAMTIFPESRVPADILKRREVLCDSPDELPWDRLGELTTELFQTREPIADGVEDFGPACVSSFGAGKIIDH